MLSSTLAERLPAMCGSDTLATLVSRTSMNVASITVAAISHGFISAVGPAYSAVVAISYWVRSSAKEWQNLTEYDAFVASPLTNRTRECDSLVPLVGKVNERFGVRGS